MLLQAQGNPRAPRGSIGGVHEGDPHSGQLLPDLVGPLVLLALPRRGPVHDLLQHLLLGQPGPPQGLVSEL